MNVLELFAGSRSIGKVAESYGYKVFSSDFVDYPKIDYVTDILEFDVEKVPFIPDMLWASPPCTSFSIAAVSTHWEKGTRKPKTEKAKLGLAMVQETIDIIEYFKRINPDLIWFIENPRGMLRKFPIMENLPRTTVTYCTYGDNRMKPTDIWTNSKLWHPRPMCKNGNPDCHHERAPRGSKTGTQGLKNNHERSKIPWRLCEEVVLAAARQVDNSGCIYPY